MDPYLCSALLLLRRIYAKLVQFLAASGTRAHVYNHRGLAGAMRIGHAAPALGGFSLSVGTSPRPQVSRSASLSVPVADRLVAGRPGVRSIWVLRVTFFFNGEICLPCAWDLARP